MTDIRRWASEIAAASALPCTVCAEREPRHPSRMCGVCFARLRRDISTLVGAHTWLGVAMLSPIPAWKAGTIHRAGGPAVPFPVAFHDARVDIAGKLGSWARAVAEEHVPALAGPADGQPEAVARWLVERLPWISDQPWCAEMARELAEAAHEAYGLAPWNRHRQDLPLPCPGCDYLTLSLYGGDELIMCRNLECCLEMTRGEYDVMVARWREENPTAIKPSTRLDAA